MRGTFSRWLPWAAALTLSVACVSVDAPDSSPPSGQNRLDYLAETPAEHEAPLVGETLAAHFIDVGQGTAILLEFPCGTALIDTGGEENPQFHSTTKLREYLNAFFAEHPERSRTLDLLLITHPHIDHTRGLSMVLREFTVKNIVNNGDFPEDLGGLPLRAMAEMQRSKAIPEAQIATSELGAEGLSSGIIDPFAACPGGKIDPQLRVLWGRMPESESVGSNANDDSVVLRVDFGEASFLFLGDLEKLGIARMLKQIHPRWLDADVMQVPHHGSKNSTAEALVRAISPTVAVIPMGPYERNIPDLTPYTARAFGHPHGLTIADLTSPRFGVKARRNPVGVHVGVRGAYKDRMSEFTARRVDRAIYATGWDGDVVVKVDGEGHWQVHTHKPSASERRDK